MAKKVKKYKKNPKALENSKKDRTNSKLHQMASSPSMIYATFALVGIAIVITAVAFCMQLG